MILSQIQSKIYFLTKTNSTSLPNATMLILINNAYERVASLIMQSDSRWIWDDTNNTDFPIATTNLVSGQEDYELATTHLQIHRVEVSDSAGNFRVINQFSEKEEEQSLTELSTQTGIPTRYRQVGTSVILDPKPNYNYSSGLKVYFQRGPTLFTSGDLSTGTALPGFNSLYHDLIPLWVAYDFGLANAKKNTNQLMAEIDRKENAMKQDYALRFKDDKPRLKVKQESNK